MKPGLKGIVHPKMFFLLFNTYQEGEKKYYGGHGYRQLSGYQPSLKYLLCSTEEIHTGFHTNSYTGMSK